MRCYKNNRAIYEGSVLPMWRCDSRVMIDAESHNDDRSRCGTGRRLHPRCSGRGKNRAPPHTKAERPIIPICVCARETTDGWLWLRKRTVVRAFDRMSGQSPSDSLPSSVSPSPHVSFCACVTALVSHRSTRQDASQFT